MRRFSSGCVVCNIDAVEQNVFTSASELALCGRPLNDTQVVLPLSKDLLLPESLNPEDDLRQAEREKGLTEYRLSFLKVERKQDNAVEAGQDGFEIKIKNAMKFRCMKDPRASAEANSEKVSCKNFFSKALGCIRDSDYIMKLFRYRFERVGQNFKVQRPYVVASKGISLKKDAPLKVASNTV